VRQNAGIRCAHRQPTVLRYTQNDGNFFRGFRVFRG
jgi:hypothetical protein